MVKVQTPSVEFHGTGAIIGKRGLLVTNTHIITYGQCLPGRLAAPEEMRIEKRCRSELCVKKIEYTDPFTDLALLRVQTMYPLGDYIPLRKKSLQIGERVWVMGFPSSNGGILNRAITTGYVEHLDDGQIVTSATIGCGSSGGPIVDSDGHLVGIVHSSCQKSENDLFAKSHGFTVKVIQEALDGD